MKTRSKTSFVTSAAYCIILTGLCSCNSGNGSNNVSHYTPANQNSAIGSSKVMETETGKNLFLQHCEACHGVNGDARNNNSANLQWTRLDSLSIATTIRTGKGTMPLFDSESLPNSDVAQIVLYVRTLQK